MKTFRGHKRSIVATVLIVTAVYCAIASTPEKSRRELAALNLRYNAATFIEAAMNGDKLAVSLFIDAGMDANVADEHGATALYFAAGEGHIDVVTLLLQRGAKHDIRYHDRGTVLMLPTARKRGRARHLQNKRGCLEEEFENYAKTVAHKIEQRWSELRSAVPSQQSSPVAVLEFHLHEDGRVTDVKMLQTQGPEASSYLCELVVRDSAPFSRSPDALRTASSRGFYHVTVTFEPK